MRAKPQKRQMSTMSLLDQDNESINGANSISSQYTSRPRSKSTAAHKLIEGGMDEIIPIQHTHSSNHKIEGQYQVDEPGNYVLVFGKVSYFV
ncbi:hypothetical protein K501DRAFT_24691 [Backusella circina FSU 941]|nr:hypothetical protein K501DRAFT_24691 [Backusella circina FSU 941]